MNPYRILLSNRDAAEKFWRFVRLTWDIGPGEEQPGGSWIITIPPNVDLTHLLMSFLRDEFGFGILKDLNT